MGINRRDFLRTSALLAGAASIAGRAAADEHPARTGKDLIADMEWLHEPLHWQRSGDSVVVETNPKSDFWREPSDDFRDSGHFFYVTQGGNFSFRARFSGKYNGQYDHAGLMVRADAENWMKCGTEFYDGKRHASVVFTRGFSDWSTMPDLSESVPVWWRVQRKKDWVETQCSLDGKSFSTVRQGYFAPEGEVQVGIMCAAPKGAGFEVVFDNLKLEAD
jgi:regulation of enolase protein 1 (concanavalin A-like superfamily)